MYIVCVCSFSVVSLVKQNASAQLNNHTRLLMKRRGEEKGSKLVPPQQGAKRCSRTRVGSLQLAQNQIVSGKVRVGGWRGQGPAWSAQNNFVPSTVGSGRRSDGEATTACAKKTVPRTVGLIVHV